MPYVTTGTSYVGVQPPATPTEAPKPVQVQQPEQVYTGKPRYAIVQIRTTPEGYVDQVYILDRESGQAFPFIGSAGELTAKYGIELNAGQAKLFEKSGWSVWPSGTPPPQAEPQTFIVIGRNPLGGIVIEDAKTHIQSTVPPNWAANAGVDVASVKPIETASVQFSQPKAASIVQTASLPSLVSLTGGTPAGFVGAGGSVPYGSQAVANVYGPDVSKPVVVGKSMTTVNPNVMKIMYTLPNTGADAFEAAMGIIRMAKVQGFEVSYQDIFNKDVLSVQVRKTAPEGRQFSELGTFKGDIKGTQIINQFLGTYVSKTSDIMGKSALFFDTDYLRGKFDIPADYKVEPLISRESPAYVAETRTEGMMPFIKNAAAAVIPSFFERGAGMVGGLNEADVRAVGQVRFEESMMKSGVGLGIAYNIYQSAPVEAASAVLLGGGLKGLSVVAPRVAAWAAPVGLTLIAPHILDVIGAAKAGDVTALGGMAVADLVQFGGMGAGWQVSPLSRLKEPMLIAPRIRSVGPIEVGAGAEEGGIVKFTERGRLESAARIERGGKVIKVGRLKIDLEDVVGRIKKEDLDMPLGGGKLFGTAETTGGTVRVEFTPEGKGGTQGAPITIETPAISETPTPITLVPPPVRPLTDAGGGIVGFIERFPLTDLTGGKAGGTIFGERIWLNPENPVMPPELSDFLKSPMTRQLTINRLFEENWFPTGEWRNPLSGMTPHRTTVAEVEPLSFMLAAETKAALPKLRTELDVNPMFVKELGTSEWLTGVRMKPPWAESTFTFSTRAGGGLASGKVTIPDWDFGGSSSNTFKILADTNLGELVSPDITGPTIRTEVARLRAKEPAMETEVEIAIGQKGFAGAGRETVLTTFKDVWPKWSLDTMDVSLGGGADITELFAKSYGGGVYKPTTLRLGGAGNAPPYMLEPSGVGGSRLFNTGQLGIAGAQLTMPLLTRVMETATPDIFRGLGVRMPETFSGLGVRMPDVFRGFMAPAGGLSVVDIFTKGATRPVMIEDFMRGTEEEKRGIMKERRELDIRDLISPSPTADIFTKIETEGRTVQEMRMGQQQKQLSRSAQESVRMEKQRTEQKTETVPTFGGITLPKIEVKMPETGFGLPKLPRFPFEFGKGKKQKKKKMRKFTGTRTWPIATSKAVLKAMGGIKMHRVPWVTKRRKKK